MSTYAFSTLEQAKKLQQHGFNVNQAEGLVEVIALSTSNLATKQDIEQIKSEMRAEIKHECHGVSRELADFKEETRQEFNNIHVALAKLDNKILSMTISLGVVMVSVLGAYTYLLQWIN